MSSKSAAHPPTHGHSFFSRKVIFILVMAVAAMFFITISYYPLIFNSEQTVEQPATVIK